MQWLGGVSYSVYLWHWPLLILWPFVLGGDRPALAGKLGIVVATLMLAWATKLLVEDPVRTSAWLRHHRPRWTFAAVLVGTACVFATVAVGQGRLDDALHRDTQRAARVLEQPPRCFGAASSDPDTRCVNRALRTSVVPTPVAAAKLDNSRCSRLPGRDLVRPCAFGVPAGGARQTFAVVGDSHAAHWRAALDVVARDKRWHGVSISRTGCPFSRATKLLVEPQRSQCRSWNDTIPRWFLDHPEIHTVFVAAISGTRVVVPSGQTQRSAQVRGFEGALRSKIAAGKAAVIALTNNPDLIAISRQADAGNACAVARDRAIRFDPQEAAARRIGAPRAQVVNLNDALCGPRRCRPVIGGALAYKDIHHFTRIFATTLGPLLERRIDALPARL